MTGSVTFIPWECSWIEKVLNGPLYALPCFSSGEPEVYGSVLNLSQPFILSCLAPVRGRLRLCLMCIHCTLDVCWQCQYPSQPGALGSSYRAPLHFEWDWPGLTSCWTWAGRHLVWKRTPHGSQFLLLYCVASHQVGEQGRPSAAHLEGPWRNWTDQRKFHLRLMEVQYHHKLWNI